MSEEEPTEEQLEDLQWAIDHGGALIHYLGGSDEDQYYIILPVDLVVKLETIAKADDVSMAEIISRALERESKRRRRQS